jgi:membrane protease YdiL (CAAX protease family)
MDLAASHAHRLASGEDSQDTRYIVLGLVGIVFLAIGVAALVLIIIKRPPMGLPIKGSSGIGDGLGLRFLLFFVVFLLAQTMAAGLIVTKLVDQTAALLIVQVLTIAAAVAIARLPIGGRGFTFRDLGVRYDQFGRDCLYGALAFFANLPAVVVLVIVGQTLLQWIPTGGHPIQSEVLSGNLWLLILTIGPVTAVLEEVTFRGMLFQGLAQRMRLWPAIILSSLAFAMIHPQGGALWLALGWIGGMAAYLTYLSKSLVPAIVMHALNNTFQILMLAYLTGGL